MIVYSILTLKTDGQCGNVVNVILPVTRLQVIPANNAMLKGRKKQIKKKEKRIDRHDFYHRLYRHPLWYRGRLDDYEICYIFLDFLYTFLGCAECNRQYILPSEKHR